MDECEETVDQVRSFKATGEQDLSIFPMWVKKILRVIFTFIKTIS